MRVALYEKDGTRHAYDFEPTAQKWSLQAAGAAHLIGLETHLPNDLAKVFVKRWNKAAAPANRLLMETIIKPLPNTPRVLGVGQEDSGNYYYFFSDISTSHRLLDKAMRNTNILKNFVLQRNVGLLVCKSAAEFLEAVERRGYVYPDFTHKNIMIGGARNCSFIDVDSSFPVSDLRAKKNNSQDFAMTYWSVWRNIVGVETDTILSRTMVLSFAVVWARAAALLRQGAPVLDVQAVVLNPRFEPVQAPFWRALKDQNLKAFAAYLGVAETQTKSFFDSWTRLLVRLEHGEAVAWAEIVRMAEATLKLGREGLSAPRPSPSPSPSPSASPSPWSSPIPKPTHVTPPPSSSMTSGAAKTKLSTPKTGGTPLSVMLVLVGLLVAVVLAATNIHRPDNHPREAPAPGQGPSFDCTQVISEVLKTICGDNELSSLDRQLSNVYNYLSSQPTVDKEALKLSERQWIQTRLNCRNRSCIEQSYRQRLATLAAPGAFVMQNSATLPSRTTTETPAARPPISTNHDAPSALRNGSQVAPSRMRHAESDNQPTQPIIQQAPSTDLEQPSLSEQKKNSVISRWTNRPSSQ